MSRPSLPRISKADLRDVASEERVERIWSRLEQDLEALRAPPRARASRVMVWAAAASFAAFGAGMFAGRVLWKAPPAPPPSAVATHDRATVDVFAAGSQERSYTLPGGGVITLAPGSMVELERSGGSDVRLRLLAGEASLDTGQASGQPPAIVSGEATVATAPGSMVRVQKRDENLDVRVVGGSARVSSPAGSRALLKGDRMDDVPTRTRTTAVTPTAAPVVPVATAVRVARPDASSAAVAAEPTWRELHAAGKFGEALAALKQQHSSLGTAVTNATSADELMKIRDLALTGGDRQAAIAALHRVADEHGGTTYGSLAARELATHYQATGEIEKAKTYLAQAAQKVYFTEGAMCAQMRAEDRAGNKDEAAVRASEYLGKYPNGPCKDEANRILASGGADEDGEPSQDEPAPAASGSASASAGAAPAPTTSSP